MELKDYIVKRGEDKLAKDLGVSIDTVRSWRYGTGNPQSIKLRNLLR